jgi:uncharacterized protein YndB with AHSA1/START domain
MTTMTRADETTGTVTFGTFTLERTFDYAPKTVFEAYASRDAKYQWFAEGEDFLTSIDEYRIDFRVGGQERLVGPLTQSGRTFDYNLVYGDIVDDERIVASYDVLINGRRISVSLLTVEFQAVDGGAGTHLLITEQGAFLDGLDTNDQRILGATESLNLLERYLRERQP